MFEGAYTKFDSIGANAPSSNIGGTDHSYSIQPTKRKDEKSSSTFEYETVYFSARERDKGNTFEKTHRDMDKINFDATKNSSQIKSFTSDNDFNNKRSLEYNRHGIFFKGDKRKKLKLVEHGERIRWQRRMNRQKTSTQLDLKCRILEFGRPTAIQKIWNIDSSNLTGSNSSKATLQDESLSLGVETCRKEKIILQKRAPIRRYTGLQTPALSNQSSYRQVYPKTAFVPINLHQEQLLSDSELRVMKMLLVSAYMTASPSSERKTGTILDGVDKIWNDVTQVTADKRRLNVKRYNLELFKLQSKRRYSGKPVASLIGEELDQGSLNGKDESNLRDGVHKRYSSIVKIQVM